MWFIISWFWQGSISIRPMTEMSYGKNKTGNNSFIKLGYFTDLDYLPLSHSSKLNKVLVIVGI